MRGAIMPDSSHIAAALAALPQASGRIAPPRIGADGTASVILDVTGLDTPTREALEADIRRVLGEVEGIAAVRVVQTAEKAERRLIAVGSGKGGVGKSTLAANLAIAMKRLGFRTGLVDADIYGPSQPRLMQATGERPTAKDKVLNPVETPLGRADAVDGAARRPRQGAGVARADGVGRARPTRRRGMGDDRHARRRPCRRAPATSSSR